MLSGDSICPSLNTRTVILMNKLPIHHDLQQLAFKQLQVDDVAYLNIGRLPNVGPGVDPRPVSVWGALADCPCGGTDTGLMRSGRCHLCFGTGKPIHTLTVDCWRCGGTGFRDSTVFPDGIECAVCTRTGSVSVDVVVAELVPFIKVPDTGYPPNAPERFFYVSKAGSLRLVEHIYRSDTYQPITPLGPPLQPGDWVAVLRKVER